ncbi:MAG: hypothetical protein ACOC15_01215, partial [Desulfovibrionales bacterium]
STDFSVLMFFFGRGGWHPPCLWPDCRTGTNPRQKKGARHAPLPEKANTQIFGPDAPTIGKAIVAIAGAEISGPRFIPETGGSLKKFARTG